MIFYFSILSRKSSIVIILSSILDRSTSFTSDAFVSLLITLNTSIIFLFDIFEPVEYLSNIGASVTFTSLISSFVLTPNIALLFKINVFIIRYGFVLTSLTSNVPLRARALNSNSDNLTR